MGKFSSRARRASCNSEVSWEFVRFEEDRTREQWKILGALLQNDRGEAIFARNSMLFCRCFRRFRCSSNVRGIDIPRVELTDGRIYVDGLARSCWNHRDTPLRSFDSLHWQTKDHFRLGLWNGNLLPGHIHLFLHFALWYDRLCDMDMDTHDVGNRFGIFIARWHQIIGLDPHWRGLSCYGALTAEDFSYFLTPQRFFSFATFNSDLLDIQNAESFLGAFQDYELVFSLSRFDLVQLASQLQSDTHCSRSQAKYISTWWSEWNCPERSFSTQSSIFSLAFFCTSYCRKPKVELSKKSKIISPASATLKTNHEKKLHRSKNNSLLLIQSRSPMKRALIYNCLRSRRILGNPC